MTPVIPYRLGRLEIQPIVAQMRMMGGASELLGHVLIGERTKNEWTVIEKLGADASATPGQFSVSYKVRDSSGLEAFMKAADMGMAFRSPDPARKLQFAIESHNFERSVLELCRGNRFDRVVTALDSGSTQIPVEGYLDFVFFIIFEMAEGDLRRFVLREKAQDLAWVVSAIHNYAVAFSQIHSAEIYHNDFKPANALVFPDIEKMADLGCATSPNHRVFHDNFLCPGDSRFAPPEQLYQGDLSGSKYDNFVRFKAGDLYNLGSVAHFLITKRMLTPEILQRLDHQFLPQLRGGGWGDGLEGVLPYWAKAFATAMSEFKDGLPSEWLERFEFAIDEIRDLVFHLCEPDLRLRGDLSDSPVSPSKYSLQRVVSRTDNLRQRIQVISRAR